VGKPGTPILRGRESKRSGIWRNIRTHILRSLAEGTKQHMGIDFDEMAGFKSKPASFRIRSTSFRLAGFTGQAVDFISITPRPTFTEEKGGESTRTKGETTARLSEKKPKLTNHDSRPRPGSVKTSPTLIPSSLLLPGPSPDHRHTLAPRDGGNNRSNKAAAVTPLRPHDLPLGDAGPRNLAQRFMGKHSRQPAQCRLLQIRLGICLPRMGNDFLWPRNAGPIFIISVRSRRQRLSARLVRQAGLPLHRQEAIWGLEPTAHLTR